MNRNIINFVIQALIAVSILLCGEYAKASESEKESGYYVFCYFMNNGEDGVHLALSRDGYNWNALNGNKSVLPPPLGKNTKLTRDPSITYGEDGLNLLNYIEALYFKTAVPYVLATLDSEEVENLPLDEKIKLVKQESIKTLLVPAKENAEYAIAEDQDTDLNDIVILN